MIHNKVSEFASLLTSTLVMGLQAIISLQRVYSDRTSTGAFLCLKLCCEPSVTPICVLSFSFQRLKARCGTDSNFCPDYVITKVRGKEEADSHL
jgi:hypothetical protein